MHLRAIGIFIFSALFASQLAASVATDLASGLPVPATVKNAIDDGLGPAEIALSVNEAAPEHLPETLRILLVGMPPTQVCRLTNTLLAVSPDLLELILASIDPEEKETLLKAVDCARDSLGDEQIVAAIIFAGLDPTELGPDTAAGPAPGPQSPGNPSLPPTGSGVAPASES